VSTTQIGVTRSVTAAVAVLLAVNLTGCAREPSGHRGGVGLGDSVSRTGAISSTSPDSPTAWMFCQRRLSHVVLAQMWTAGALLRIGPEPMPFRSMSRYRTGEPVAMCLVKQGLDRFAAVAVVIADGDTHAVWNQTTSRAFTPPA
jgi:hypothetical protein